MGAAQSNMFFGQETTKGGISPQDVLRASSRISEGIKETLENESCIGEMQSGGQESSAATFELVQLTDLYNVGSRFNQWRKPVAEWGSNDPEWEVKLKSSPYVGEIEFGRKEWARARQTVDAVLDLLFKEVKDVCEKYEGLKIERYVRQGSSREGFKVIAPDEFDTLLLYHLDGIFLSPQKIITQSDKIIPEFCKMTCNKDLETIQGKFPRLYNKGVFKRLPNGKVCLNSRALHQQVFQSIIDQSTHKIVSLTQVLEKQYVPVKFRVSRKMNPPSINLTIRTEEVEIDVDVVPGILLRQEQVPDPADPGSTMDCPVYAVFKWMEESSVKAEKFNDHEVVWRVCSSGYEKHTADVARCNRQQRHIITALRVLKTYFSKTKKSGNITPPQIVTVLRSYHLKHIAYYILLHTQYMGPQKIEIPGVERALQYFFRFLRVSLEKKRLPHFFHSNIYVTRMFPGYPINHDGLRFNLLGGKSDDALNQALLSLRHHLIPNLGFQFGVNEDLVQDRVVGQYQQHILLGEYF